MRRRALLFGVVVQTRHRIAPGLTGRTRSPSPSRLQVAGDAVPRIAGNLEQDGRLRNRPAVGTPGMDRETGGVLPALRCAAAKSVRRIGLGHRGDEGAGVGMNWLIDDLARRAALDDRAEVHDRDAIREVPGRCDVMRDVEEGDAALAL